MVDRIKITEDSQCTKCTTKEKRSPVLFLNSWYHMLSGQNDCRKNSCYQVTKKALLHGWKISCQTHAHIHTCKEKCIAEKLGKPLFLHERDAAEDFIACFAGHEAICPRAVVHCYTGDKKTLRRLLDMGFYIGITGWICDERRADDLREAVSILPLDRVMIETDAPYLTPRGFHLPRTNVPQNITYVARTLAQYMGVSEEVLTKCAKENTERFWKIG